MKKSSTLLIVLALIAIVLHLACCEWRNLEMRDTWWGVGKDGKAVYGSDTTGTYGSGDTLVGLQAALEVAGESLGRQRGAIWLNTNSLGEGFGLYARDGMDVDTAKTVGVIIPIGILIAIPIVLIASSNKQVVASCVLAALLVGSSSCVSDPPYRSRWGSGASQNQSYTIYAREIYRSPHGGSVYSLRGDGSGTATTR